MSTINLYCVDQRLTIVESPNIYSGDINYDKINITFDEKWSGFLKTAVFYRDKNEVYYQILDVNNSCVIPKEVLIEKGFVYFGVFGVKENIVLTSEIVKYKINEGVPIDRLIEPDPRPDIFEQILEDYRVVKESLLNNYNDFTDEVNVKLNDFTDEVNNKSDKTHKHDERYYTETEVNNLLNNLLIVETYTFEMSSTSNTIDITKDGYKPIGVVGMGFGNPNTEVWYFKISGNQLSVYSKTAVSKVMGSAEVLYMKNN